MNLRGNTLLITGGATGIGLGMARAFLERGNPVAVCGRRREKLDEASRALPGLRTYRCDVSDAGEREALLLAMREDGHEPNVLVNNAARMRPYDLTALGDAEMVEVRSDLQTNLLAPIELTRLLLPALLERANPVIININSPGGVVPVTRVPVYCASKAALHSYTLSLRYQLAGRAKVIEVYPPSVDTAMMAGVSLETTSVESFTGKLMARLAGDKDEIWIGEGRWVPVMSRVMPRKFFELVNRTTEVS